MDNSLGSFKELYDVKIKAIEPITIGGTQFEAGETIMRFESLSFAELRENHSRRYASGGNGNAKLVFWENVPDVNFTFVRGVFTKSQLALAYNSKLWNINQNGYFPISCSETKESDANGNVKLSHMPIEPLFIYKVSDGSKPANAYILADEVRGLTPYTEYLIDYSYNYNLGATIISLASPVYNGFLELEGKTSVKDDVTGQVITGIIKIPKLKLLSDVSLSLGDNASPIVASFNALGLSSGGGRDGSHVAEFYFLRSDLASDM